MEYPQKKIYLIRHGETEWTLSGRHTGITDIELTENGKKEAERVGKHLRGHSFSLILSSPLRRAVTTCQTAGLLDRATIEPLLKEWNYGKYEGLTTPEIWTKSPDWNIFSNGAPGGEAIADIEERTHQLLERLSSVQGDIALFSHGHFLRSLAAKWLGLSIQQGRLLALSPGSISILGFERSNPVLTLWNQRA